MIYLCKSRFLLLVAAVLTFTVVVVLTWRKTVSRPLRGYIEDYSPAYESKSHTEEMTTTLRRTTPEYLSCPGGCSPCQSPNNSQSCAEVIEMSAKVVKMPTREYNRKVIMSLDTVNLFYAWFAPITTLIWYEVMEWQPVFIFLYPNDPDFTPGPLLEFIVKYIEAAGGGVINIVNTLPEPHYLMGMVLMCSRYSICVTDWPEDTYVMISDADIWPLSKETFERETSFPAAAHVFDPPQSPVFASCYIGMNVSTWREIMGFKKGDDIMKVVAGMRDQYPVFMEEARQWGIDQEVVTRRIRKWNDFRTQVHFYGHDRSKDRLDRRPGPDKFVWRSGLLDSHLLRPGFVKEHWSKLRELATHILNDEQLKWVDDYAELFCSLVFCTNTTITESGTPVYHPKHH